MRARELAAAFGVYAADNHVVSGRRLGCRQRLDRRVLGRGQVLGLSELAAFAHLPYDEAIPGLDYVAAAAVAPPPGVASGPWAPALRGGRRCLALNAAGIRLTGDSEARPRLLRNPVYVGKVFFRDTLDDGPHPHLVDEELFDRVQALLTERGEDYSKHASANSPFLLAGLVVCARCRKYVVGTSALGNRYRYRYYTCSTRQRSGTRYCDVERLPAEEPDAAILDALLCTYERTDLFDKAVTDGAVPARKALLQALVHEIRVEGRDRVVPWFRVPGGANPEVRALARSAPPAGAGPVLRRVVRLTRRLVLE